ncbi:MAG: DUF99 family protein [Bradymonadales bacterium]|nr:DUF99 family protein [Bradymonadales bacterium]
MANLETLLRRGRLIRAVGIDDAPFTRGQRRSVLVVGAICAGTRFEGLLTTRVRPDGFDATRRVIAMLQNSKFLEQLHLLLLDGITLGGFNVLDLQELNRRLDLPVVAVTRQLPDFDAINRVISTLPEAARRQQLLSHAGPVHRARSVHFQVHGTSAELVTQALERLTDRGAIPEPLRLAHLIGGAIVNGESGRRA